MLIDKKIKTELQGQIHKLNLAKEQLDKKTKLSKETNSAISMNKITIFYVTNLGHNHVFSDVLSGSNPTQKAWYLRQIFINHIST